MTDSAFLETYDRLVDVGRMYMRGKSAREIADHFDVSTRQVNKDIEEWKALNNRMMRESGTFAQQLTDIIAEVDQTYKMVMREVWEVHADAKADMSRRDQLAAMKQVSDINTNRAKIFGDAAKNQDEQLIADLEETQWQVDQVQKLLRKIADENPSVAQLIYEGLSAISNQAIPVKVIEIEELAED